MKEKRKQGKSSPSKVNDSRKIIKLTPTKILGLASQEEIKPYEAKKKKSPKGPANLDEKIERKSVAVAQSNNEIVFNDHKSGTEEMTSSHNKHRKIISSLVGPELQATVQKLDLEQVKPNFEESMQQKQARTLKQDKPKKIHQQNIQFQTEGITNEQFKQLQMYQQLNSVQKNLVLQQVRMPLQHQIHMANQMKQINIENAKNNSYELMQSPQRLSPVKGHSIHQPGLNGKHINPMNASINQTYLGEALKRSANVQFQTSDGSDLKSNEFNQVKQNKRQQSSNRAQSNDMFCAQHTPKKVNVELANAFVMQHINLIQQKEENKKSLNSGVLSRELLQMENEDAFNDATENLLRALSIDPSFSQSGLAKQQSNISKSNIVNRKSQLGSHDIQNLIDQNETKPQSSQNHMIPLRGTIFNGPTLGSYNGPQPHAVMIQPQIKFQQRQPAVVVYMQDQNDAQQKKDHIYSLTGPNQVQSKIVQSSPLQPVKGIKQQPQNVNVLLNMSKQRAYVGASEMAIQELESTENMTYNSINNSDYRQSLADQTQFSQEQKQKSTSTSKASRQQDLKTQTTHFSAHRPSGKVISEQDAFQLNGKQIISNNNYFHHQSNIDQKQFDKMMREKQFGESSPYDYNGLLAQKNQVNFQQTDEEKEKLRTQAISKLEGKKQKKLSTSKDLQSSPSTHKIGPVGSAYRPQANSFQSAAFDMQFYSGEKQLQQQQSVITTLAQHNLADKQAQHNLFQSNMQIVSQAEADKGKIRSYQMSSIPNKNLANQVNNYYQLAGQRGLFNSDSSHNLQVFLQPSFGQNTMQGLSKGNVAAYMPQGVITQTSLSKHLKNQAMYQPQSVQINGKQLSGPIIAQMQPLPSKQQHQGFKALQDAQYLAEQRMIQLQTSLKLVNFGYNPLIRSQQPGLGVIVNQTGFSNLNNEIAILSQLQQLQNNNLHLQLLNNETIPIGIGDYTPSYALPSHYGYKYKKKDPMSKKNGSKIPFENAYVEDCYKFIICYGNNSGIVRKAFERRSWWIEIQPVHSMFNFKWQPFSNGIKFARLGHMEPHKPGELGATGQVNAYSGITALKNQQSMQMYTKTQMHCQMVNHLEYHKLLTEKYNLLNVMQKFCDSQKENPFEFMPITFYVEFTDPSKENIYNQAMTQFFQVYHTLEANKNRLQKLKDQLIRQMHLKKELEEKEAQENQGPSTQKFKDKIQSLDSVTGCSLKDATNASRITKFKTFNFEKRTSTRYSMPLCHFDSYNLWLLKPTHLNRGRGIHVFNDLDTLHKLIKQYCSGKEQESLKKKDSDKVKELSSPVPEQEQEEQSPERQDSDIEEQQQKTSPTKKKGDSHPARIKHNTFIIQKYIERPLLINKRKFDMRVWVTLTQDHDLFFFREGYLRTSSSEFGIDLANIDDAFVHLTNNAVQKHATNFGSFEDGNQLSFTKFQNYIDEFYPSKDFDVYKHLVPQMEEIIIKTFNAVRKQIDPHNYKYCFELFGYDFILDEDFNMYLIEVNTNPCIEESSNLLKTLLPRMLEDMFKLTVDVVFPKSAIRKRKEKKLLQPKFSPQKSLGKSPIKRISTADKASKAEIEEITLVGSQSECLIENNEESDIEKNVVVQEMEEAKPKTPVKNKSSVQVDHWERKKPYEEPTLKIDEEIRAQKYAKRIHSVNGYPDNENMWHRLGNIDNANFVNSNKYTNKQSLIICQVTEKVFKLKRNPIYPDGSLPRLLENQAHQLVAETVEEAEPVNENDEVNGLEHDSM